MTPAPSVLRVADRRESVTVARIQLLLVLVADQVRSSLAFCLGKNAWFLLTD